MHGAAIWGTIRISDRCSSQQLSMEQDKAMKIGPFGFWVISPFAGTQLWTFYCVLNASGLPAIAVELSC